MVKVIEGTKSLSGKKFCIVVSRFNDFITKNLLKGCLDELKKKGIRDSAITVVWVPGAFEIPLIAKRLAKKKTTAAVICLGCIIEGETLHFDLIAASVASALAQVAVDIETPIIFEVLATYTIEQAYKRSDLKGDNKGKEAARAAIETVNVLSRIK